MLDHDGSEMTYACYIQMVPMLEKMENLGKI